MQTGGRALRWSVLHLPCFALFVLLLHPPPLLAQQSPEKSNRRIPERSPASTATLQGAIHDAHGRAVPGVQIDLHNVTGGQHYSTATDAEGIFRLRDVRLGIYEIKFTGEGFQTQTMRSVEVSGPAAALEVEMHGSDEKVPETT